MHHRLLPVLTAAVLLLPLAACGSDDEADGGAPAPSTSSAAGAAADPGVVVALDDFAAVHALTLGVVPDLAFETFQYASTEAIYTDQGLTTAPYGADIDLERVAAADPDIILGVSLPTTAAQQERLQALAPTTVFDYTSTWEEQLTAVAAALGREDAARELITRLEGEVSDLSADLRASPAAGASTSVIAFQGEPFALPSSGALGSLLGQVGLTRPPAQQVPTEATDPFITFSPERLPEHDGDELFLMTGGAYDPAPLTSSPLWPSLSAVRDGDVQEVSAELWFGSSAFSTDWVLDDLRAVLVDGGEPGRVEEAAARFREFTAG